MFEETLSMEKLSAALDNAPVAVYVNAVDNLELLYANEKALEFFLTDSEKDTKYCYQAAGFDAPCPFCELARMSESELLVREYCHAADKKTYQLSGKLIEWSGRMAHIEYILDITEKQEEDQKHIRQKYNELLMQHYRTPGPNALIVGHCNITQNKILEIIDFTDSDLLKILGTVREEFFTGVGNLVVDEKERQKFMDLYLNEPALAAFRRNDTEQILNCLIKLPKESRGRYVQFKVNLVETPDTGDVTGVLTVTDTTEQTISDRILRQLSVDSYDLVIDADLSADYYTVLTCRNSSEDLPQKHGKHSVRVRNLLDKKIVPKDKEHTGRMLDADYIWNRLNKSGAYSFHYSVMGEQGDILTKNLTISPIDLRLSRVCLARTDITDSLREQRRLLNVVASTFELMGFIEISSNLLTMYTRQTVQEDLPPYVIQSYDHSVDKIANLYNMVDYREQLEEQFSLKTMVSRLGEQPKGYNFVFPYQKEGELRYKQINVMWGDDSHKSVCMVRADVTNMLSAERRAKSALEHALELAEEANQAKSDFLSSMSHDIRTPLNAVMGMTALATAHLDDRTRVEDCLRKISFSSKHLLSLVNDILDMSKIERSKIILNRTRIALPELMEQLSVMLSPQAKAAGLTIHMETKDIIHSHFYGDALRINQILINIISNAIKFTPEGGSVAVTVQELPAAEDAGNVKYQFTVEDTGIGMTEEFLAEIFDPFTRSHSSAQIEGTGLGLSITKGLVDLMGGKIEIESHLHQGTRFQVELECETAPEKPADSSLEIPGLLRTGRSKLFEGCHFLAAEDNAINAEILCELLEMDGARLTVKTDGIQVVEEFRQSLPGIYDAILMDIQMPLLNGYEATRAIREMNRTDASSIPIVAMTANAFTEDIQASLDAGMDGHVAKPIDVAVLRETLRKVINK